MTSSQLTPMAFSDIALRIANKPYTVNYCYDTFIVLFISLLKALVPIYVHYIELIKSHRITSEERKANLFGKT